MSPILFTLLLFPLLIGLSITDIRHLRIPNPYVLLLAIGGIGFTLTTNPATVQTRLAACAGLLALGLLISELARALWRKDALGMGDIKLFAVFPFWIGTAALPAALVLSSVSGLVAGRYFQDHSTQALPFGPFLCLALGAIWLFRLFTGAT